MTNAENDTLKDRAEKFRQDNKRQDFVLKDDLIAEIHWARENPPPEYGIDLQDNREDGWQSFADHLFECLGARE